MIESIRLYGKVSPAVDYYATIAGATINQRYCYEQTDEDGEPVGRCRFDLLSGRKTTLAGKPIAAQ